MSKHSNSIGFRIGLSQLWSTTLNVYGINFSTYSKWLFICFNASSYFEKLQRNINISGIFFNYIVHSNFLVLTVYCSDLQKSKIQSFLPVLKKIYKLVHYEIEIPIFFNYYSPKNWLNSSYLLFRYIKFILQQNKFSLKFILRKLKLHLLHCTTKKIIHNNIRGVQFKYIKGIKITCNGRLGTIRNPLTQTLTETIGSVPLPKLNSYLDYTQNIILTKQGVYGIKI